jgi:hypothetical protein
VKEIVSHKECGANLVATQWIVEGPRHRACAQNAKTSHDFESLKAAVDIKKSTNERLKFSPINLAGQYKTE